MPVGQELCEKSATKLHVGDDDEFLQAAICNEDSLFYCVEINQPFTQITILTNRCTARWLLQHTAVLDNYRLYNHAIPRLYLHLHS